MSPVVPPELSTSTELLDTQRAKRLAELELTRLQARLDHENTIMSLGELGIDLSEGLPDVD